MMLIYNNIMIIRLVWYIFIHSNQQFWFSSQKQESASATSIEKVKNKKKFSRKGVMTSRFGWHLWWPPGIWGSDPQLKISIVSMHSHNTYTYVHMYREQHLFASRNKQYIHCLSNSMILWLTWDKRWGLVNIQSSGFKSTYDCCFLRWPDCICCCRMMDCDEAEDDPCDIWIEFHTWLEEGEKSSFWSQDLCCGD